MMNKMLDFFNKISGLLIFLIFLLLLIEHVHHGHFRSRGHYPHVERGADSSTKK